MRRRVATLAAVSALALALSASPALAGSPAVHVSLEAAATPIFCGTNTYTVAYGTFDIVTRPGITNASGNWIQTGTVTARNVVTEDGTRVVGVEHYSQTTNAQTGGSQGTQTTKFQLVSQGGVTAGSVNLVMHGSPNGNFNSFDFGTCVLY